MKGNDDQLNARYRKFFRDGSVILRCSCCHLKLRSSRLCWSGHVLCQRCVGADGYCRCGSPVDVERCTILDNVVESFWHKEVDVEDAVEQISRILECSVCYDRIAPPLKLCVRGHAVCADCRSKIVDCPMCCASFVTGENVLLTRLVDMFPFRCRYKENGCSYVEAHFRIRRHERLCRYRDVPCRVPNCRWSGTHDSIYAHVEKLHESRILPFEVRSFESNGEAICEYEFPANVLREERCVYLAGLHDRLFWHHFHLSDGEIYMAVQMVGTIKDAREFSVDISGGGTTVSTVVYGEDADLDTFFLLQNKQRCENDSRPGDVTLRVAIKRKLKTAPRVLVERFVAALKSGFPIITIVAVGCSYLIMSNYKNLFRLR